MSYILSEESRDLLQDVRNFCQNELKEQVKEYDESGEWPRELYEKAVEMQLHMLDVPEQYGGLGLDRITCAALVEQIAIADAGMAVTLSGNGLALKPVLISGNEEQKKKCCDIIINGGWGCFGLTEPNAGSDPAGCKTTAVRDGNDYILNGRKCFITSAEVADFFVITATTNKELGGTKGMSAFLVYKGTPGLSVGNHEKKMGVRTSITSDVVLDDVRVPAENMIGPENTGFITAMKTLDLARINCAVVATGVSQRCIDEAVEYGKQRKQFGKPILANQGLQFKVAEMRIRTEAARGLIAQALNSADAGLPFSDLGSCAKAFAGDAVQQNAIDAVQIFGGYGFSREYPVEKLYRDAKIFSIFEGTNEIQKIVISRSTIGKF